MNATLPIYSLSGTVIATAIVTESALSHEELMTSDYVQLSWNSDEGDTLPAGAYITIGGEKYSLLDPYTPTRANEAEYQYTPQFQSRIMAWQKQIVPIYTYEDNGTTVKTREMDWDFTGSPADAMYMVQQAIKNETGETWTVQLADSLPATITLSSQSGSIFSVLSDIAGQCETEWWTDKATNTLYLSQCKHGTAIALTVGDNVGVPNVTPSQDGYYTRFYVFGSTRNVTQDSGAAATNSVVNKRLTLDPATYPGGYIDARPNLQPGEIFTKTLFYDDVYPSSKLAISDVRARLKYSIDPKTNGKIQTGEDSEGNPIYEQYAIWYFKIAGFDFDPATKIPGMNLSVHFETGQLAGRDFELDYHDKADDTHYTDDALPFVVEAGDYEIMIDESEGIIIPGLAYIIPQDGDEVILYNIEMPAEYTASAREELAETATADIAKLTADNNSYEMDSNPVAFDNDGTDLALGQAVTYTNGDTTLQTRVLMVEKHLDYACQQRIRIGNEIIKGNTQQLREEVTQASQNIDILAAFNNLSTSLSNAYAKVQREMLEGFARIGNMWKFDPDDPTVIYSDFSAYVNGFLSAKGKNPSSGSTVSGSTTLAGLTDVSITGTPEDGQVLAFDVALGKWKPADATAGLDEEELAQYLTANNYAKKTDITAALAGYATQSWVTGQGYALKTTRVIAGAGLTGGGTLAADRTLSLATVGTAGTYTKVTVDQYGRVTGHQSLAAADIPALSISKISGLQAELNSKLDAADFEELFEKVYVSGYGYAIRAKLAFYSEGWISTKGQNPDAGSTTAGIDEAGVLDILTKNGYATQSWVTGRGYITASALSGYLTQSTADGRYFRKSIGTISDTATDVDDLWNCGIYLNVTGNTGTNSSFPSGWGLLLNFAYQDGNFRTQLYADSSGLRFNYKYDNSVISNWRQLLDANNIGSYALTPSNYTTYTVTKTGGGASGTWGIGISGNAATATKLQTARVISLTGDATGSASFDGTANAAIKVTVNHAAEAVKLKTARTIWGQSFNGTANISGDMNGVGIIYFANGGNLRNNSEDTFSLYTGVEAAALKVKSLLASGSYATDVPEGCVRASVGVIADSYVQVGNARLLYDAANNALYVQKADGTVCGFYSTGFISAKGLNDEGNGQAEGLYIADKRNESIGPRDYGRGIYGFFMANGTDGLHDGGSYHTVLHVQQWDNNSGGKVHQLGLTDNGGLWMRTSASDTSWGSWSELSALAGLTDVSISSPQNGQSLVYRNGVWKNETVSGGGSATVDWDDIQGKPSWIGDFGPTSSLSSSSSTNLSLTIGSLGKTVSSLYATYLGGTTKEGLFTGLSYSGSTLSITIGGTTRTATIQAGVGGASSVSVSSSSSRNISVTVDGHTDYVNDLYATYSTYADQLRTARTIWGQSFNGSGSVSGDMTGVGRIYFSNNINIRTIDSSTVGIYASNNAGGLKVKSLYVGTTYGSSAGDGLLVVNNNGNAVTIGAQNATFCHIYNSANIPFMFNNTVASTKGDLGTTKFRWATVYAKNALNTSSDLRLKTILQDIPLTVVQVAESPSFLYRWKKDKDAATHAGSAAQYWQQALPEAVLKGEDGYLSMEYDRIALAAVITTARTVIDHETRIKNLEQKILCLTTPQGSDALPDK